MEAIVLILLCVIPFLIGKGFCMLAFKNKEILHWQDNLLMGMLACIGFVEAAHLPGAFKGWTIFRCEQILFGLLLAAMVVSGAICFLKRNKKADTKRTQEIYRGKNSQNEKQEKKIRIAIGIFALLFVAQLIYIYVATPVNINGDMTVETVQSFMREGVIYRVNPLTGQPYLTGMPSRLKILSLSTFYTMLCHRMNIEASVLVWKLIPMFVLFCFYLVYGILAKLLFKENALYRWCFLAVAALLVWIGDYTFGMDGFGLLHSGFRGVTLRGCLLVPYMITLLMRKKYVLSVLCIIAEACMVWTLYGMGICFMVLVFWIIFPKIYEKIEKQFSKKEKHR